MSTLTVSMQVQLRFILTIMILQVLFLTCSTLASCSVRLILLDLQSVVISSTSECALRVGGQQDSRMSKHEHDHYKTLKYHIIFSHSWLPSKNKTISVKIQTRGHLRTRNVKYSTWKLSEIRNVVCLQSYCEDQILALTFSITLKRICYTKITKDEISV
jgi:hypothetical protein